MTKLSALTWAVGLLILFIAGVTPRVQASPEWLLYTSEEFSIQFLSLGTPEQRKVELSYAVKVIWHFGFLDDGTNGYVDATRLKTDSFTKLDVVRDAAELRQGIEQGSKTKVRRQRQVTVSGVPAIEFETSSVTSKGTTWYSIARMLVVNDTLFTIGITAPTELRLQSVPIQRYLSSFKILESRKRQ